jgi:hypothetical protein
MKPRNAKTFKQICSLATDNHYVKSGWIMVDVNRVSLVNQKLGEVSTGEVEFDRRSFNALIDWYSRDQQK